MPWLTIVVPARNEEANIGPCLESLIEAASEADCEIIVANDGSTDRTADIVAGFAGVKLLEVPTLPPGWVGKNHALACATRALHSDWLLFTDADTRHAPGSIAPVLERAAHFDVYSLSPAQEAHTWWERAVIPRVYRELEKLYRFEEINSPACSAAAANGQYLLIRRAVYEQLGGHRALSQEILEDVALARAAKHAGYRLYFGPGAGIVRTRMYRRFSAMWEGWTKNLFLLYGRDSVAMLRAAARAAMDLPGGPLFSALLVNSLLQHRKGHSVAWKGREYASWSS